MLAEPKWITEITDLISNDFVRVICQLMLDKILSKSIHFPTKQRLQK